MRVLLAHDFSSFGEEAFDWINAHLRTKNLEVVVAYATPIPPPSVTDIEVMTTKRAALEEFIDKATKVEGATYRAVVAFGPAADAILDAATVEKVDLIVVGSHGRTGINHLILGSVAERVVREAKIPVVVVKNKLDD